MWSVRPSKHEDLDAILTLAASLGAGMTTLPNDRDTIAAKIDASVDSFSRKVQDTDAQYLLVLENVENGQILGVSAVYPSIGHPYGFFSYHIDRLVAHSYVNDMHLDCSVLHLSNEYTGLTEIGTLAVDPALRNSGAGKVLAKARYMLMACFPELFADKVIAEMRGWQNEAGESPVWNAVGRRFFNFDFQYADEISATKGAEFIANLIPKYPIYLDLLPEEAQLSIAKAHATSSIAMRMLLKEGFRYEKHVDVFDGGPQLVAPLTDILTIKNSSQSTLVDFDAKRCEADYLICSTEIEAFRLTVSRADNRGDGLERALGISLTDNVRFSQL